MTNAFPTTQPTGRTEGARNRRRPRRPATQNSQNGQNPQNGQNGASRSGSAFAVGAFSATLPSTANPNRTQANGSSRAAQPSRTTQPTRTERPATGQRSTDQPARPRNRTRSDRPTDTTSGSTSLSSIPTVTASDEGVMSAAVTPGSSTFAELGVPDRLLPVLTQLGAAQPFPVQVATLPATLAGRDVLGRGRTGSGKTIAFAVPMVANLVGRRSAAGRPRGLILVPTRELALQVQRTVDPLAKALGLTTATVFGGVGYGPQTTALHRGVDILIACPGRLEDLINRKVCDLRDIEVIVLDEADHLADLGFLPGVKRILRATPKDAQRMLFSATLDNGIGAIVREFLVDPVSFSVDESSTPVGAMSHHVFAVNAADRNQVVHELAAGSGRRLLFTRTKHGAKKWANALTKGGIPAVDLHGNLSQNARERNLAAFASGAASVLVATDIAARGIHVDGIELVVHVDPPTEHKAYLHRSGRTARAGATGTVVTLMLPEQKAEVTALMRHAGISATVTAVRPGDTTLTRVAG